ncbi:MAG: hypothetical protein BGO09_02940 [Bacteroidetes bacterium 47-18]|nr:MAG: hypothetical protein BGO09_02940 [Bacteroidetes bacterium 47-18]
MFTNNKPPKTISIFYVGKKDRFYNVLNIFFLYQTNISVEKLLTPNGGIDIIEAESFPVVVVDGNSEKFGFKKSLDLLALIIKVMPEKKVIVFTDEFDKTIMQQARAKGAKGYFFRDLNNLKSIADCINCVFDGQTAFNQPIMKKNETNNP